MSPFELSTAPISLLYVEDDPIARELTSKVLQRDFPSLEFYSAENGADGLELYRQHRPDVVLTDINMPVMDGIRMSQEILAMNPGAHIVVISSHSELNYLLEAIKMGAKRYVLKPLNLELLIEAVSGCLTRVGLERQVRRQEQFIAVLSQVVEQSSRVVAIANRKGYIEYVNGVFSDFTGYRVQEILGRHLRELQMDDAAPARFDEIWNRVSTGVEWHGERINMKKNGDTYLEAATIAPLFDCNGRISHYVTVMEDVTAKRRRQEEIERAQKLESLGVLAGGIAHDFNNILTGILGNISCAQSVVTDPERVGAALDEAEKASQRAAELTRRLLTFAAGGKPVKKQVSVRHLVEETLSLALSGSNVLGEAAVAHSVHAVDVDTAQMRQAFHNILINAVQAMSGGTVTVRAGNVTLEEGNGLGLLPGSYVQVCFADHGCGIPQEEQKKIFDPYFSTKSGHSGLGLTSAHSIVTRHGGHLGVESTPGGGATLICHLPAAREVFAHAREILCGELQRESQPGGKGGRGRILVMDDECLVRKVTSKMLESLGYQVTTCTKGEEAIELYKLGKGSAAPFVAVIMDLTVIGGMGGREAAARILAADSQAKLVVSSGYFEDPVLADYQEHGFRAVLPKPYRIAELAEVMSGLAAS
jgi:two-component system, cell cycle sensor histidine kinase and response regulator CckA